MPNQSAAAFLATKKTVFTSACVASTLLSLAAPSPADELPLFRKGMWEFHRTVDNAPGKPLVIDVSKCTNPSEDMKKQNSQLTKAGCTFSPPTRIGNSYTVIATCKGGAVSGQSKSVIAVDSDSSYKLTVESQSAGKTSKEFLVAKRTGSC